MIVLTPDAKERDKFILRLQQQVAVDLAPEARVRAVRLVFGPYSPFPIAFRVMGPDPIVVRAIADQVLAKMQANPNVRHANEDWTERAPVVHFVLDQDRLRLIGLSSQDVGQQIQFLTTGVSLTQVREDIVERLEATASVLGAFAEWECAVAEVVMETGDMLAMFIDGITEATNAAGDEFGEDRLIGALRVNRSRSPAEIAPSFTHTVQEFGGRDQADDLTLIIASVAEIHRVCGETDLPCAVL